MRLGPAFVLSLDKELVWGSFDHTSDRDFARRYPDLRGVVDRLLVMLDEYELAATWAVVGHLFLRSCVRGPDGRAHPELPRPAYAWYRPDWFDRDPCTDVIRDPLWYGPDVIDAIRAADTAQEIGCHSFSHVVFGDPGTSEAIAEADVAACVRVAAEKGIILRSFVFPRNSEGHHEVLRRHGFVAFRGADPTWYAGLPGVARRAAHLADQALALPPPVVAPKERLPGLYDIPGSMLLLHRVGGRRLIPTEVRIAKGRLGIRRAIERGGTFHLWLHPFNLAVQPDAMFTALEGILSAVARERDRGRIRTFTMGGLADALACGA